MACLGDAADSSEFEFFEGGGKQKVIYKLRDLLEVDDMGGTMRLGAYTCALEPGSLAQEAYGCSVVSERHRHRYELNNRYRDLFEAKGLYPSGVSPDQNLVEITEVQDHPWMVGSQFHPEFQSKPLEPHPLFRAFIEKARNS